MQHVRAHSHRVLSGGTLLMFFAASIALLAIASYKPREVVSQSPIAVLASVGLTDDDGGRGLFHATGLVPGRPVSRCLKVDYAGPNPAGTVYVSAAQITGRLAANLRIKLEQGTGGGFASCAGFTGTVVYDGLLGNLADPDPTAPRTDTGWSPQATDSRTYRVTATVRDVAAAQGRTSTATFRWFLFGMPTPAPAETTAPPVPGTVVSAVPAVPATVARTDAVDGTDAVAPVDPVDPVGTVAAARVLATTDREATTGMGADPATAGGSGNGSDDTAAAEPARRPMERLREALAEFGRDLKKVAVRTSTHSVLPVVGAAVLSAFLVLQNRIDRLDPKLALTPARDLHLVFRDPPDDAGPTAPAEEDV